MKKTYVSITLAITIVCSGSFAHASSCRSSYTDCSLYTRFYEYLGDNENKANRDRTCFKLNECIKLAVNGDDEIFNVLMDKIDAGSRGDSSTIGFAKSIERKIQMLQQRAIMKAGTPTKQ